MSLLTKTHKTKDQRKQDRVPLILTYNPANPNVAKIIAKHWHILQLSERCKLTFKKKPIIAYRRCKNISDHLVRAKCSLEEEKPILNKDPTCKTPWKCPFCPKHKQQKITSAITNRSYQGPDHYTCQTRNVIYLITCKKCNIQYVGETYRTFRTRMMEHICYVRRKDLQQPIGLHFNLRNHTIDDMKFQVIQKFMRKPIPRDPERISREEFWMDQLKTLQPQGLNNKNTQRI